MAVFRVNKTKNYTVMSNYHLRDLRLSLKAIGLLSKILSLPENWDYSINGLVAICKEQRSAVESALRELKQNGYMTIEKHFPNTTESGRIEYVYNIFETPKQGVENQGLEFLPVEKPQQLNKDRSSKEDQNNIVEEVISYLNQKAGTKYKHTTESTKSMIKARLKEGFELSDFKTVIDKKVKQWKGSEMEQYLRPQTLFGTKMESYLNQNIVQGEKKEEIKPKRYKEFEPEPEIDAIEMPDDVRANYNRFISGL